MPKGEELSRLTLVADRQLLSLTLWSGGYQLTWTENPLWEGDAYSGRASSSLVSRNGKAHSADNWEGDLESHDQENLFHWRCQRRSLR